MGRLACFVGSLSSQPYSLHIVSELLFFILSPIGVGLNELLYVNN